jgi:hypothetical protein
MNAHAEGRVITPPSNAAWRCRQFVLATLTNVNQHVDVAFASALGIQAYDPNNPDQQDLVRAAITSLRQQQRGIIMALSDHPSVIAELFAPISEANSALSSMSNIHQALTNFPQFTSNGYALALGWAANVLPSSGHSASELETAQVLSDIIALRARLTEMRFPTAVHDFMEQLLKDLETGVVTASFEGSGALHRACNRAVSEIAGVEDQLRSAEPNLNDAQRSYLTEAAEKVEKIGKIAGGLSAAIGFAQKLVPLIANAVN